MNPKYRFLLQTERNGVTHDYAVYPLYDANLSKDYERESNQMFFRAKLNGKLVFAGADYDIINNASFETQFTLVIYINRGGTSVEYWRGVFYKTDCKVDEDARNITVTPNVLDEYKQVLAGMDKEYDLIDLKPTIDRLTLTKRPLIQIYIPGENVVSCFLSGMYWEQDCEVITDETELKNEYHFSLNSQRRIVEITQTGGGTSLPKVFNGAVPTGPFETYQYNEGGYTFHFYRVQGSGYVRYYWNIEQNNVVMWQYSIMNQTPPTIPFEITLQPVSGTGATGTVTAYVHDVKVYARYLLDVDSISGISTFQLSANDMATNNRNYNRVVGYGITDVIWFTSNTSLTPTEWGIKQPGVYYQKPYSPYGGAFFPVGRSQWGELSVWFNFSTLDEQLETDGRKEYTLNDAFPISSVISVLLNKIAPDITHEATTEYSELLYGLIQPIPYARFRLYITPKSNILAGEYQQPAQKAPITLKMVTDMLRDCFRAYWFIEDGKLKIEHISWFKNGGNYIGTPNISYDLTKQKVTRNGKEWAYATSQFEYAKTQMPERYQFGWMDEVTKAFEGYPIEIRSRFVEPGKIEQVDVMNFTSDIDYMLLNPGGCSQDGFALMAATPGTLKLPILKTTIGDIEYINQNALLAFINLQRFYLYDMPAYPITVNESEMLALAIQRGKKQTVRFPVVDDPNPMELIKTHLGDGQVEKISVNLSSRNANATLMFDTYKINE